MSTVIYGKGKYVPREGKKSAQARVYPCKYNHTVDNDPGLAGELDHDLMGFFGI